MVEKTMNDIGDEVVTTYGTCAVLASDGMVAMCVTSSGAGRTVGATMGARAGMVSPMRVRMQMSKIASGM